MKPSQSKTPAIAALQPLLVNTRQEVRQLHAAGRTKNDTDVTNIDTHDTLADIAQQNTVMSEIEEVFIYNNAVWSDGAQNIIKNLIATRRQFIKVPNPTYEQRRAMYDDFERSIRGIYFTPLSMSHVLQSDDERDMEGFLACAHNDLGRDIDEIIKKHYAPQPQPAAQPLPRPHWGIARALQRWQLGPAVLAELGGQPRLFGKGGLVQLALRPKAFAAAYPQLTPQGTRT